MVTFTYETFASPLHDAEAVAQLTEPLRGRLEALGGTPGGPASDPEQPYLLVVATGGTEQAVLDAAVRRVRLCLDVPVVLVAHPRHNSLPAALEALARLQQDGVRGRIAYVGDEEGAEPAEALADLTAVHRLHRTRLGQIGRPSDWLVASSPDADALRRRWGVSLVPIPMPDVIETHVALGPRAAPVHWREAVAGPDRAEIDAAAALRPTLAATIAAHQVDAITVRCFDFLGELATSGCLALADLNEEGVVAGCEGDVASAVAMLWIRHRLGSPSWVANPAQVDPVVGELVLAHCTIAPSLTDGFSLDTHFESGLGVGISGIVPEGPVTLVRLGGAALERRWIADAEVVGSGHDHDLCRTQATVRLDPGAVADLLRAPLGNHLVLVPGHHRERLERWWHLVVEDPT